MSWIDFIEYMKGKDCQVTNGVGALVIECDGKVFRVEVNMEEGK